MTTTPERDSLDDMDWIYRLRRWARQAIVPVLCLAAVVYFGRHAVEGDSGVMAWLQIRDKIEFVSTELAVVKAERRQLEHKVALLRPESLDADMLEEQARDVLGYAHKDDVILLYRN